MRLVHARMLHHCLSNHPTQMRKMLMASDLRKHQLINFDAASFIKNRLLQLYHCLISLNDSQPFGFWKLICQLLAIAQTYCGIFFFEVFSLIFAIIYQWFVSHYQFIFPAWILGDSFPFLKLRGNYFQVFTFEIGSDRSFRRNRSVTIISRVSRETAHLNPVWFHVPSITFLSHWYLLEFG